jgi:hypothetical protein
VSRLNREPLRGLGKGTVIRGSPHSSCDAVRSSQPDELSSQGIEVEGRPDVRWPPLSMSVGLDREASVAFPPAARAITIEEGTA